MCRPFAHALPSPVAGAAAVHSLPSNVHLRTFCAIISAQERTIVRWAVERGPRRERQRVVPQQHDTRGYILLYSMNILQSNYARWLTGWLAVAAVCYVCICMHQVRESWGGCLAGIILYIVHSLSLGTLWIPNSIYYTTGGLFGAMWRSFKVIIS